MTWYWLGIAGIVLAGAVAFDVLDFFYWGFIAAGLIFASYKLSENEKSPRR
jgi:hypothetical protein